LFEHTLFPNSWSSWEATFAPGGPGPGSGAGIQTRVPCIAGAWMEGVRATNQLLTVLLFDTAVLLFHSESNGLTLLDSESFNFSLI
jgi:hypothetical protein